MLSYNEAKLFADCSGDSILAPLSGANIVGDVKAEMSSAKA